VSTCDELTAVPDPASLRQRALAGATAVRARGSSLLRAEPIGVGEAYRRQWFELLALVGDLSPRDWHATTSFGCSVHALVAHVVAQQGWIARSLFHVGDFEPPPGTEADHWGLSRPTIDRLLARPVDETITELRAAGMVVLDACDRTAADAWARGRVVALGDLVTARTFELWIHSDDIRRSTGRPLVDPDAARLDLLCRLAASFTPIGMQVLGCSHPGRSVRLVLTGAGGGTWVQALAPGEEPAEATDLTVVVAGATFCRIAGKLLGADAFDGDVIGDPALLADVLAGASAFAE
jgi:uncharacterized protein (TIGR03083 family)